MLNDIRSRIPHIQRSQQSWFWFWRIYGLKPYYRLCLFDWTIITYERKRMYRVAICSCRFEWSRPL